jgi:hypothetical protein
VTALLSITGTETRPTAVDRILFLYAGHAIRKTIHLRLVLEK